MSQPSVWSCGHEASECCAECHRLLTLKANAMVALIDDMMDARTMQREKWSARLAGILRGEITE